MFSGSNPGINEGKCDRIARYSSVVLESETGDMESCGSLVMAFPSFGSATARETFFSSLIESSKEANRGVT